MRNEKISASQAYFLIMTYVIGTSLSITDYSVALENTWLSMLIALIYATPLVIIYGSIMNKFPDMELFQIMEFLFGKIIGKVLSFLYTFYFLHLGSISIRNITEYIQVVSFPETPQYFSALFIGLLAIYVIKSGIEVLTRVNKFLFPLLIAVTILTFIMGIPKSNLSNLLPFLYYGWKPVLEDSFTHLAFPFAETVVFLSLLNIVSEKKKSSKIFLLGIYGGGIILLNVIIRNIVILGFPNLAASTFPSYYAVSLVDVGTFIRGIELIVSINIIVAGFIKISVCLYGACLGICRIFSFDDYKWITVPMGLLMIALSFILYENTMHMFEWVNVYKFYAIPFQIVFPLIIFIFGFFRKDKSKSKDSQ
jgi:spore germination protein KB